VRFVKTQRDRKSNTILNPNPNPNSNRKTKLTPETNPNRNLHNTVKKNLLKTSKT